MVGYYRRAGQSRMRPENIGPDAIGFTRGAPLRNWLDVTYLPEADTMRAAAWRQVDGAGLVQDVCGAPHFDRPGVAPEGQAFFLLMEAAAHDWARRRA